MGSRTIAATGKMPYDVFWEGGLLKETADAGDRSPAGWRGAGPSPLAPQFDTAYWGV